MSKDGDKTSDWMNKLMGKKIGETSDEIVSFDKNYNYRLHNLFPFQRLEQEAKGIRMFIC